jgi:hypothetical protein
MECFVCGSCQGVKKKKIGAIKFIAADTPRLKTAAHAKQGSEHHWKFSKVHTPVRDLQKSYKIMKMNMFPLYDKVKRDIENIRGLRVRVRVRDTLLLAVCNQSIRFGA